MTDQPAPLIIRINPFGPDHPGVEVVNPEVLDGRGVLIVPPEVATEGLAAAFTAPEPEQAAHATYAAAEHDPVKSWMLDYPGHAHALPGDPEPGAGPGWGDDDDLDAGRCCPWCRGALTEHNRAVHDAGYAMGERHTLAGVQQAVTEPLRGGHPLARGGVVVSDPWRDDVPYEVLRTGLHAVASDAVARQDHHTAAYAYSVLAGEPIPPVPDEPACRVCGCTENAACDPPCSWVEPDLCSACVGPTQSEDFIAWRGGACRLRDLSEALWVLHADGWWRSEGREQDYGSLGALRAARGDLTVVV